MAEKRYSDGAWHLWQHLPLLVVLVTLWMFLWRELSWFSLLSGVVVALLVTRAFYLPPVELSGRFNPFWLLVFLGKFASELVAASFLVALQAFYPRGIQHNAVVEVKLRTRSDFVLTLTSVVVSLIPGSVVVEIDRYRSVLFLHSLGVADQAGIDKVRAGVLGVERRLILAFGSRDDVRRSA